MNDENTTDDLTIDDIDVDAIDATALDDFDFTEDTAAPAELGIPTLEGDAKDEDEMTLAEMLIKDEANAKASGEKAKAKAAKAPKAPKAPKAAKLPAALRLLKVKKARVRKSKMTPGDLEKMIDVVTTATVAETDLAIVKRCLIMDAATPLFALRDIYRELVHPRFKATVRGCYNVTAILASLTAQR